MNGYWPEDDRPPPMVEPVKSVWRFVTWTVEDFLVLAFIGASLLVALISLWNFNVLVAALFIAFVLVGVIYLAYQRAWARARRNRT